MATITDDVVPGSWIVFLKPHLSADGMAAHLESIQAMTRDPDKSLSCEAHYEFDLDEFRGYSGKFDLQTKEDIEKMDGVLSIEPVRYFRHCQLISQPNAPWGLERISQSRKVQQDAPYRYRYRDDAAGQNTIAYIIDTGINASHVEFEGRASRGPKFVTSTSPASDGDVWGHGTHVAGIVGSRAYGVAKKVQIISIKVFSDITGGARTDDIIKALEWIVSDARARGKKATVNMSLGGPISPALNAAVAATVRSGIVVCVAAGNDMAKSPASEPLAVTVAAMDKTDEISDFSNYGRLVDVFGPGTDITSTWIGSNSATRTISGTSMATPHVTGLACCLLSDGTLAEKTPYGVASQITIRADKNKLLGLDRITSNSILQVV
ncbi:putative alkaline serine protease [Dactylonectria macrodidyma]|uniref:Alkaline serine protease n=1 Tax=Dactylonectria macrodidyma TaxID=307937 RepID=A0A9P9FQD6_9HYPO|nr:putative alkaline serine protease [Dactylonectria macrodidyma]